MSELNRKPKRSYPFFSDKTSLDFFRHKKSKNWFCNKPLSPIQITQDDETVEKTEQNKQDDEDVEKREQNKTKESCVSGKLCDSGIDPEDIPETVYSDDSTEQLKRNKNLNTKELEIHYSHDNFKGRHTKKFQILQNIVIKPPKCEETNTNPQKGENNTRAYTNFVVDAEHELNLSKESCSSGELSKLYDSDADADYNPETDYSDDSTESEETDTNPQKIEKNEINLYSNPFVDVENEIRLSKPTKLGDSFEIQNTEKSIRIPDMKLSRKQEENIETTSKQKLYKRKQDMCFFCENDISNFARHLKRNHFYELEVQEIFSKNKKSSDRRHLLAKLKKKGNYLKNSNVCQKPVKQVRDPDSSYLPCTNCLGFYRSKFLYRHKKICCSRESSKNAQSEGQNLLIKNKGRIDQTLKEEVFPRMRADKISLEAKSDFLICAFGARYLKIHREKHFINVTSRKMRELSKILLEIKKLEPTVVNLFNALQPKFYDKFVEATKIVAKYDNNKDLFISPTLAMNIATSLKQCCDLAIHMLIKEDPSVETANCESKLKSMISLLQANWRFDVSNRASNDLNIKKFNKITIVPLASDLKILKNYLISKAEEALTQLKLNSTNETAYITLLETIYCRVILLNRRRPGELQRMLMHTYETSEKKTESYEEFNEVVTESEKILLNHFKRIVIRGKRGRGVPVIFSIDTQDHLKELLKVRSNFLGPENPYLFGKPHLTTPIYGYKVVAKYAALSGAKNPESITCSRLRKHLATLSQLFNLNENEIEQLANFMGHTPGVHRNNYRLPDDVYQTAKISKLLLLMEKGGAADQKGKSLDEINIDMEENLLENNDYDNKSDEDVEYDTVFNTNESTNKKDKEKITQQKVFNMNEATNKTEKEKITQLNNVSQRSKRTLVRWTEEQKKVVTKYFAVHIKKGQPPKRFECEDLKSKNTNFLENKDWLKIKVFVQNIYTKQK